MFFFRSTCMEIIWVLCINTCQLIFYQRNWVELVQHLIQVFGPNLLFIQQWKKLSWLTWKETKSPRMMWITSEIPRNNQGRRIKSITNFQTTQKMKWIEQNPKNLILFLKTRKTWITPRSEISKTFFFITYFKHYLQTRKLFFRPVSFRIKYQLCYFYHYCHCCYYYNCRYIYYLWIFYIF